MKTSQVFLVAVIGITGLFGGCSTSDDVTPVVANSAQVNQTLARNNSKIASGQGSLVLEGRVQHFSFEAYEDENGVIGGTYESKSPGQNLRTHGNITCVTILPDGKSAFISAVITHRVGTGFAGFYLIGNYVSFEVQDNGEGANSPPDQFSDYYDFGSDLYCGPYELPLQTINNGNIQVN